MVVLASLPPRESACINYIYKLTAIYILYPKLFETKRYPPFATESDHIFTVSTMAWVRVLLGVWFWRWFWFWFWFWFYEVELVLPGCGWSLFLWLWFWFWLAVAIKILYLNPFRVIINSI